MNLALLLPAGLAALAALLLPLLIHLARRSEQRPTVFAALRGCGRSPSRAIASASTNGRCCWCACCCWSCWRCCWRGRCCSVATSDAPWVVVARRSRSAAGARAMHGARQKRAGIGWRRAFPRWMRRRAPGRVDHARIGHEPVARTRRHACPRGSADRARAGATRRRRRATPGPEPTRRLARAARRYDLLRPPRTPRRHRWPH